jgi:hypothetical protein
MQNTLPVVLTFDEAGACQDTEYGYRHAIAPIMQTMLERSYKRIAFKSGPATS